MLTVGPAAPAEPEFVSEFEHILFATDFGPGAEKEAAFALSLAQEHKSKLTVLHTWTGPAHGGSPNGFHPATDERASAGDIR